MTWLALRAFIATPLGRYLIIAALVVSAAFAAGWHERNVGWNERDVQAKQEIVSLNKSWVDAEAAAIGKAKADAKAKEDLQAKKFLTLQSDYQKEHARANKADTDRAAAVRLRLTTSICPSSPNLPDATATAAGSDGATGGEFLGSVDSAFLKSEAIRANEVVRELTLCQSTLISERPVSDELGK